MDSRDPDRFPLQIMSDVLGGGMSSRLFQEIREQRGLAYAVQTFPSLHQDTGEFCVYVGTNPDNAELVLGLIRAEFADIAANGVTQEELDRAKESAAGHLVLSTEATRTRMVRMGRSEVTDTEVLSAEDVIERLNAVTMGDVQRVAQRVLSAPTTLAIVGPFNEEAVARFAASESLPVKGGERMIRVLVSGAAGRMGREVVRAVSHADGMQVVAAVDPGAAGTTVDTGVEGAVIECRSDLATTIDAIHPDVMVDFTHPSVVEGNLKIALARGVDCVVGTTGLSEAQLEGVAALATPGTALFFAPNFAIGAVLMMDFAARAARYLPNVEIIELHHDQKADAPSGTALRTAELVAAARDVVPPTPGRETEIAGLEGARGAVASGVHVHSIRLPGLVAHQEVLFGGQGQTLSIRHDTIDRSSFMPGVVLAVREVGSRSGLIIGLDQMMGE